MQGFGAVDIGEAAIETQLQRIDKKEDVPDSRTGDSSAGQHRHPGEAVFRCPSSHPSLSHSRLIVIGRGIVPTVCARVLSA